MMPERGWLRAAGHWLARRRGNEPIVLMYHRVAEVAADPWGLCVSPENFAQQLEVLRRVATPVPLEQLTDAARRRALPPRSVVVTFDDGYADLLHAARPLLEAHDVPATAFITTGNLGTDREFWWDELERLLLRPGTLPRELELAIGGRMHRWELGSAAAYSEGDSLRERRVRASGARAGSRHALFHAVWKQLFSVPDEERQRVLAALHEWAGAERVPRVEFRSLHPDEVVALAQGGLVEIGAHTVTHPALPAHSSTAQSDEIVGSKKVLEQILGRAVTSFSYPHGEYSAATLAIIRKAELRRACTVRFGRVSHYADPLQLPRIEVQDWTAAEFEERLAAWFS